MTTIQDLEKEIQNLKIRNSRVDADKAWETCLTRKIILIIFTYLAIGLYLSVISVENPWVNAIVPAIGFLLSTLTLPFIKNIWLRTMYHK